MEGHDRAELKDYRAYVTRHQCNPLTSHNKEVGQKNTCTQAHTQVNKSSGALAQCFQFNSRRFTEENKSQHARDSGFMEAHYNVMGKKDPISHYNEKFS